MVITESTFEQLDPGIYGAVCTRVIDLGTQPGYKPTDAPSHQILLGFEVEKFMADGRPFYVMFTAFAGLGRAEKSTKLCKFLEGMRGKKFTAEERKGFDPKRVLGVACELVIGLSDSGKSRPEAAARPRVPVAHKPERLIYFSMAPGEFTTASFDSLSKWEKSKVQISQEWDELHKELQPEADEQGQGGASADDDIPF